MRSFAGLLFVCSFALKGDVITSGSITLGFGTGNGASFSGPDFSAQIDDFDYFSTEDGGGFIPFEPPAPVGNYFIGGGSDGIGSGVSYDGVFYYTLDAAFSAPTFSIPWADASYSLGLITPLPTITGPGLYPVTVSFQLNFCLYQSLHSPVFYCGGGTGTATGAYDYTYGNDIYDFLSGHQLDLTVVAPDPPTVTPEPSTISYVGFAALAFGSAFLKRKSEERRRK
jgi:hypothetical protein